MTTPKESSELQDIINIRDGGTAVNENLKPVKSSNSSTSTHKENIPTLGIKKQNPSIPEVKTTDNKESKSEKGEPGDGDDDKEEDEDEEEDEYVVEKIIKKRTVDGNVEYLIKWKDWPSSTNTWEPQQHLHCPDKVQEFEQKLLEAKASAAANAPRKKKEFSLPQSEIGYGFERGLEPEKILAATDTGGALKFVIKWKGRAKPDIVLAAEANQKCPQTVIQFYEDRLTWTAASVRTMSEELASGSGSTNGENDDSASQGSSSGPMDQ